MERETEPCGSDIASPPPDNIHTHTRVHACPGEKLSSESCTQLSESRGQEKRGFYIAQLMQTIAIMALA